MTNSRWNQSAKTLLSVIFILLTISTAGCANVKELQYNTNCNREKLLELKGNALAILSYEYDDELLVSGEPVELSGAQIAADNQKAKLLSEFDSLFEIRDVSTNLSVLKGRKLSIDNPQLIREILRDIDADGGILITNAYGYEMGGAGGILDRVLEKYIEPILPEEGLFRRLFEFMLGPTEVESYFFASNTFIVDKEGNTIWNFHGKVYAIPAPSEILEAFKPNEFARGIFGLDPSQQRLVKAMTLISNHYTGYIRWLVQADLDGMPDKNYFTGYPKEKITPYISVYPASDQSHLPYVKGTPGLPVAAGEEKPGLWDLAKSGGWHEFGQWAQAWAAFKLLLVSLVAGVILTGIAKWVGEESCLGRLIALPMVALSVAGLVAIYYILRAIL